MLSKIHALLIMLEIYISERSAPLMKNSHTLSRNYSVKAPLCVTGNKALSSALFSVGQFPSIRVIHVTPYRLISCSVVFHLFFLISANLLPYHIPHMTGGAIEL